MKNLKVLEISTSDLSGMEHLTNLEKLNLTEAIDISPLAGCRSLRELELSFSHGLEGDLSPLSGLTQLTNLSLTVTEISDLKALSTLSNLKKLSVDSEKLSDLNGLQSLTELTELRLRGNVSDISPLSSLNKLVYLDVCCNNITDVSPLFGLEGFRTGRREDPDNPYDIYPYIDLLGNPLSDEQLIELYESLDKNTAIYWSDLAIFG